jgi:hypothetical protein
MMCRARPVLLCILLAAAFTGASAATMPLHGQIVKGRVVLAGTENALDGVTVRLFFPDGRPAAGMVTDTSGSFRLHAPRIGAFTLTAERVGMAPLSLPDVQLNLSEELEVELRLAETAVPLEPLVVKGRSQAALGMLAGYYERVERQQRLGAGHVITRDRIEERQALDVSDLLRDLPSVSVVRGPNRDASVLFRSSRGECTPKVYLNGMRVNRGGAAGSAAVVDDLVQPHMLEGVEVYRGVSEMVGEFYDEGHCGVVLLWTRRDAEGGRPFSWARLIVGLGGLLALGLLLMR